MDPSSVLRVTRIQLAGPDVEVQVATVPGRIYQLESSTNLAPPWQALGEPVTAAGAETTLVHPAGAGAGRRFYRARVIGE
jgi:hypothetical protein